jgi:hypothetical protein
VEPYSSWRRHQKPVSVRPTLTQDAPAGPSVAVSAAVVAEVLALVMT